MKFSLIIPTVRQTELVKTCIESVRKFEPNSDDYEFIVIDDGSDAPTQEWLKSFLEKQKNTRFIAKPENSGFAHTVNVGLRLAVGQHLILLNNDVEFIKPVLDLISKNFDEAPQTGVIGAKLLFPAGARVQQVQHAGVVRIPGRANFIHINKFTARESPSVNQSRYFISVTGALYAIRRECWQAVGDWNENYFLSCEDTEYSLRCWLKGWHVYYNHEVEAIHIEGHTRGNTDEIKKRKDMQWFIKERQTIPKFANDAQGYDLDGIDTMVNQLNARPARTPTTIAKPIYNAGQAVNKTPPPPIPQPTKVEAFVPKKKLEIGCGEFPQPGYVHLDIRKFAHVDVVCDFSKEKLPFADGEIAEILSNHSIEHVSWRRLVHVLKEWYRVLMPGGKIFFRTPDLEFICRTYLESKTTPEHPNDENYIKANFGSVSPAWWANIKLFAGQDYDGNFHHFAFDFEMARSALERYGFIDIKRVKVSPEFSPGELQVEAYKPGVKEKAIVIHNEPERILVKRRGALGDVILTTPIVRRLREMHEGSTIHVATDCGAAYVGNQWIDQVVPSNQPVGGYSKIIDLDLSYEKTPERHIIDSYSETAFGPGFHEYDKRTEIFPTEADATFVNMLLNDFGLVASKSIVVHMAVTWKNRTWPKDYWEKTLKQLVDKGYSVIVIGHGSDIFVKMDGVHNFMKRLSIQQIAYLISISRCFVANDSGMIHVAGATNTPIVGIFTSAKGEYRMPYREGQMGFNCKILKPQVSCYGCLHKEKPPVVYADCRRGDYKCLSEITPEMVVEAVG